MYPFLFAIGSLFLMYWGGQDVYVALTEPKPLEVTQADLEVKAAPPQNVLRIKDVEYDVTRIWYESDSKTNKITEIYLGMRPPQGKVKYILQSDDKQLLEPLAGGVQRMSDADFLAATMRLLTTLKSLEPVPCVVGGWIDVDSDIKSEVEKDDGVAEDVVFLVHGEGPTAAKGIGKFVLGLVIAGVLWFMYGPSRQSDDEEPQPESDSESDGLERGNMNWDRD